MEENIGKSLVVFSRKFHLKIAKFQILPILCVADFKSNFQLQIYITTNESICWNFTHLLTMTPQDIW